MSQCKHNEKKDFTEEKVVSLTEKENEIKVIDSEGYDIEQFLCRCGNKTSITIW
ncbi:MAG: hypothetical protein PUJ55_00690 [Clostridiales bacterium]|nr:hypothetical protein [Roseburia sp.]MDD7635435.1 hypothetical protein [Clostridiales bacterium]MDY4111757.1 hypothetical protein [Roseburia sp.]